jgi:hypothetical protein
LSLPAAMYGSLKILNLTPTMRPCVHGRHPKDLVVLHETVSPNVAGSSDIEGVARYLAQKGYGIHGITDNDGNIAWALGLGDAVFWQAGGVNERSIGIEQVSNVMQGASSNEARKQVWLTMTKELAATSRLLAEISTVWKIPLVYSDGDHPGVTTHWSVSQHHPESEGHTDCWPVHLGGYFPALQVIQMAKNVLKA